MRENNNSCTESTHSLSTIITLSMDTILKNTKKIISHELTPEDLYSTLNIIIQLLSEMDDKVSTDSILNIRIITFLSCLRTSGLDHKAEFIAQAARAVLNYSNVVEFPQDNITNTENESSKIILDIVGTGGDGQNTFNVSTSSAIVASGIPNLKICKHGGKASTSNSGAGDLINELGLNDISKVNKINVPKLWDNNDFLFLLAPFFHHGMKFIANIRKLIGIPTIFNVLGPLLHPVNLVNKRVLGVYSKDLAEEYAKAAALIYPNNEIFVVWGHVGLDEVSPIGKTTIWHVIGKTNTNTQENIEVFTVEPKDFGLMDHTLEECISLGPKENADILRNDILSGKVKFGDNNPIYDYILLNTSVLYCLAMGNKDWKKGVLIANESIQNGNALEALNKFIQSVHDLK